MRKKSESQVASPRQKKRVERTAVAKVTAETQLRHSSSLTCLRLPKSPATKRQRKVSARSDNEREEKETSLSPLTPRLLCCDILGHYFVLRLLSLPPPSVGPREERRGNREHVTTTQSSPARTLERRLRPRRLPYCGRAPTGGLFGASSS